MQIAVNIHMANFSHFKKRIISGGLKVVNCLTTLHPPPLVFLQKIFQTRKEMVIKKTVARLPLPAVLPLVEEVSSEWDSISQPV